MLTADIKVFISYSHDSPQHEARVLALADRLRANGIDAMIDQYQLVPPDGWQLWMEKQIRDAQFVLLVCTETYHRRVMKEDAGKGLGVMWESSIIYSHLYNAGGVNEKFIPIVFDRDDIRHIPSTLQATNYYEVGTDAGYEKLYRRLTNQHETTAPPLGTRRILPPLPRPTPAPSPAPTSTLPPNLVHPYALQANFTGRAKERAELTAWLADDKHPIYALVAMGGMGKSALAWYWIQHDLLPAAPAELDGVMWWSFYEGESSFAKFVDEALKYTSQQQTIDAERFPSTYDRAQELRRLLQTRRILFILDGFERQLRAYSSLDAAYREDAGNISRDDRACVDPTAARLVRAIAAVAGTRAKLLITSRLMVHDLEDGTGRSLAGVIRYDLEGLPPEDALKFMREQGVSNGTDAEIDKACAVYGYHSLSLRLLSGLIVHDTRKPGDIYAAPRHDVSADLIARRHHILEQSYNALPTDESTLLSRIAAFRSRTDYKALLTFNEDSSETRFDAALEDLQRRGLLQRDMKTDRYDLHPLVRRYAYDRLSDKTATHTRLRDYFAAMPVPDVKKVQSLEDLLPAIELYHHTARAGLYDEARELFRDQFGRPLYYRFGAYQTCIELLLALFPDGEDRPPRLKDESDQAWTLGVLANSYSFSGQSRRAVSLFEQDIALLEKASDKKNLAIELVNIADNQLKLGELTAAENSLRRSIELCREIKIEFVEAVGHQNLGRLLAYRGVFDDADLELKNAQEVFDRIGGTNFVSVVRAYRALRAVLMNDAGAALKAAQRAFEFWKQVAEERYPYERDRVRVEWLWGVALVLEGKDLSGAETHLGEALAGCRRINMVDHEPDILLAGGRLLLARGDESGARGVAEEALKLAERCEFRLQEAWIHNFLARVALAAKERGIARAHAEIARARALCDGPPYCYQPALDEALGLLGELGGEGVGGD
jgi:tetratricopeptide (TPR) repeat protein